MGFTWYLKLAGIVIVALAIISGVAAVQHMRHKLAAQQVIIDNQNSKIDVLDKKVDEVKAFAAKKAKTKAEVQKNEDAVAPVVQSGNIDNVIKLFDPFRVHAPQVQPTLDGKRGRAGSGTGR